MKKFIAAGFILIALIAAAVYIGGSLNVPVRAEEIGRAHV